MLILLIIIDDKRGGNNRERAREKEKRRAASEISSRDPLDKTFYGHKTILDEKSGQRRKRQSRHPITHEISLVL